MVFYFSGTGNSQLVAREIAERTGDQLVSINASLQAGEIAQFFSERPLIFVAPTYAWRMPNVVERWIRESGFQGADEAYFVLTCGGGCGNAAAYAKALCRQKGFRFRGLAPVVMPENYLALFPTPDEPECRAIVERARPRIAELAAQIQAGEPFLETPVTAGGKLESGLVHGLFYPLFVHDRGFTVSDRCNSCGACVRRCPLNNVKLVEGTPVWQGSCTHCMACIAGCPCEAIAYKSQSRGRHRHFIWSDSL